MRLTINTRTRVVLVEDDVLLAKATRRALLELDDDFDVDVFHDPAKAMADLLERPFDVVISDFDFGADEVTGADVLETASKACSDAPRILVTARLEWSTAARSINEGKVFRVVAKPFADDVLLTAVSEAIELKRARDLKREARMLGKRHQNEIAGANARLLTQNLLLSRDAEERERAFIVAVADAVDTRLGARPLAHSMAGMARTLACKLGISPDATHAVELGALLHRIGYVRAAQNTDRARIAAIGAEIARNAKMPEDVVRIVEEQCHRYDGGTGLDGTGICMGARILAVVARYMEATSGAMPGDIDAHRLACEAMERDSSLDPEIVAIVATHPAETWGQSERGLETLVTRLLDASAADA
jgi:response regulator RpfG family c-di-GMP phosphodiesterase